jgi:TorA maturation chaperone TorD
MKFIFKYLILFVLVAFAGLLTQKICYRFPTPEEIQDYHVNHQSTEFVSLAKKQQTKKHQGKDQELLIYRVKHSNGKDFSEFYNMETHKAWVFPWETYWESRARMSNDNN